MKKFYSLAMCSGTGEQNANTGLGLRWIPLLAGLIAMFVSIFTSFIFEGIGFAFCFVCVFMSIAVDNKPSIFHTMPINYKKRTLYYFVDVILVTLLVLLMFAVVIALFICIDMIIEVVNGVTVVEESTEAEDGTAIALSSAAVLFSLFRTLFLCGGIMGLSRIKSKKWYLITTIAFFLVYAVGGLILTLVVVGNGDFDAMLSLYLNFEKLPLPWLATTLCAVFAVGAWVGSVLYVLKIEQPKNY